MNEFLNWIYNPSYSNSGNYAFWVSIVLFILMLFCSLLVILMLYTAIKQLVSKDWRLFRKSLLSIVMIPIFIFGVTLLFWFIETLIYINVVEWLAGAGAITLIVFGAFTSGWIIIID